MGLTPKLTPWPWEGDQLLVQTPCWGRATLQEAWGPCAHGQVVNIFPLVGVLTSINQLRKRISDAII